MRRAGALILVLSSLLAPATAVAAKPSFAEARKAARKALPSYVVSSCTRTSSARIVCELHRDRGAWRYQRDVTVGRSGRATKVTRARKLCRVAPAKVDRCGFKLPRR